MSYAEKLRNPLWQRKRLEIMGRDDFKCVACSLADETLAVHHIWYTGYNPWDAPAADLQTLCDSCHKWLGPHSRGGVGFEMDDHTGKMVPFVIGERCPNCRRKMKDKGTYMRCTECDWSTAMWFEHFPAVNVRPERK